jgi:hypothetical protein
MTVFILTKMIRVLHHSKKRKETKENFPGMCIEHLEAGCGECTWDLLDLAQCLEIRLLQKRLCLEEEEEEEEEEETHRLTDFLLTVATWTIV